MKTFKNPPKLNGSKRFKKKYNLKEYSMYCFDIECKKIYNGNVDMVLDEVLDYVDKYNLHCCGGWSNKMAFITIAASTYNHNPTNENMISIKEILEKYYADVKIGDYKNLNWDFIPCDYKG